VLEPDLLSPILYVVAFVTFFILLAFMNIVGFVTGKTGFIHFDFFLHWLRMTSKAYQLVMGPFQRKLGLFVMVKFPEFPSFGVMAGITFRPQPLFMDIAPRVAVHTFRRGFLVFCRKMTIFAGGHCMNPH